MGLRRGPGTRTCRIWHWAIPLLVACMACHIGQLTVAPAPMWAFVIVHLDYTAQVVRLSNTCPTCLYSVAITHVAVVGPQTMTNMLNSNDTYGICCEKKLKVCFISCGLCLVMLSIAMSEAICSVQTRFQAQVAFGLFCSTIITSISIYVYVSVCMCGSVYYTYAYYYMSM